jgi:hypothetical protein
MGKVYGGIKTCATMPTVKYFNGKQMVHIPVGLVNKRRQDEVKTEEQSSTDPQLLDIPELSGVLGTNPFSNSPLSIPVPALSSRRSRVGANAFN